ncbi:MAG: hypothetical protein HW399_1063 [Dehalococcoidia bacterium]|nr:hypothetical protein [Dehalococcoidia bacterium]
MEYLVVFVAGIIVGVAIVIIINRSRQKDIENSFSTLAGNALRNNSTEFIKLANEILSKQTQTGVGELEGKKKLIDQTLDSMKGDLQKVERLIADSDNKREKAFGEIGTHLKTTAEQTGRLQEATNRLQSLLANTRVRGQWGERMAEDILRTIGFVEGINYSKQTTQEVSASRPDYTFFLPQGQTVNMDVKFPLDNYLKYLDEEVGLAKESYKEQFLKDTRQRIKEAIKKDYINKDTVDYVLVFIPNEQVYCFVNENDRSLLDDALTDHVILCSPLTLYAMLVVIRQAAESSALQKASDDIISHLGRFKVEWGKFADALKTLGDRLASTQQAYEQVTGPRKRQLERPLNQIEAIRKEKGILESPQVEDSDIPEGTGKEP